MYKRVFDIHAWKLSTHAFNEGDIRLYESLTSIGNGYMGMRGNFEEGFSGDSHTGTYIAGIWFPDKTRVGWWKNGYPKYFGKVIKLSKSGQYAAKKAEHAKSSVRAKVEHVFGVVKKQLRFRKTRYRGLEKQQAKFNIMFALANLILADRPCLAA